MLDIDSGQSKLNIMSVKRVFQESLLFLNQPGQKRS